MPTRPDTPSPDEAREIHAVALRGAARAGAPPHLRTDLAQTVVERFLEKWNQTHLVEARSRGERAWHNYIMMAATNAYADHRLKEERRRARERKANAGAGTDQPADRPNQRHVAEGPPSAIDEYLARRHVIELIDGCLNGTTATIARLTFVHEQSTREISEQLGLSIRAVNRHKADAVARLRTYLARPP